MTVSHLNEWVRALEHHGCHPEESKPGRYRALCPAHDDHNPSLSVGQGAKQVVATCFAGCKFKDIRKALRLNGEQPLGPSPDSKPASLARAERRDPEPSPLPSGKGARVWHYVNAEGEIVAAVVRRDPGKKFSQWIPSEVKPGLWLPVALTPPRPMYRLPDVLASKGPVTIVEGEKCADAARNAWPDQIVTTWAGGANTWHRTDWTPLGGRDVSLLADGDPLNEAGLSPGHEAMKALAAHLSGLGCSVKIALPPPEWGSDVADWLEAEGPTGATQRIADLLREYVPEPPSSNGTGPLPAGEAPPQEDSRPVVTQLHIARTFADTHGARFGYDAGRDRWLEWDGTRHVETALVPCALGDLVVEAYDAGRIKAHTQRTLSTGGALHSMAKLAALMLVHDWDAQRDLLGLPGGRVLDTSTLEIRAQQREDFITRSLPEGIAGWETPGPTWEDFVHDKLLAAYLDPEASEVHLGVCEFIQQWSGNALTGDCRDERMVFLHGPSNSGKSTFTEALLGVFGSYGQTLSGKRVVSNRSDEHLQWLAGLSEKRLVVINETPRTGNWKSDQLADVISGGWVDANYMRQNSFNYRSQAHVIATGNNRPRAGAEEGIWRRMVVIGTKAAAPGTVDNTLKQRLRRELPSVFAWQYAGLRRWNNHGRKLEVPPVLQIAVEDYRKASDYVAAFAEDCLVKAPGACTTNAELYDAFAEWWRRNVSKETDKMPGVQKLSQKLNDLAYPRAVPGGGGKGKERRGVGLLGGLADEEL